MINTLDNFNFALLAHHTADNTVHLYQFLIATIIAILVYKYKNPLQKEPVKAPVPVRKNNTPPRLR